MEKEKKINKDFFLDYNEEDITQENKQIKIKNNPTNITLNNNDMLLYTTKSYSNINNINNINNSNNNNNNMPFNGNGSYNQLYNQLIGKDDKNEDKEIFIREINSKGISINGENDNKEILIKDENNIKEESINEKDDNKQKLSNFEEDNKGRFIIDENDNNRQIFRNVDSNNEVIINAGDNKRVFNNAEDKDKEIIFNIENNNKDNSISFEESQNEKGNFINADENNKEKFIRVSENENELIIKNENEEDNENNLSMSNNKFDVDINEVKDSKEDIEIKPKKVALNHNMNNNINKYSIGSIHSTGSRNSNISKKEVIYSVSSEIIGKKKYGDENITEEEYNAQPNDEYSRIIFDYINKLRRNPKYIANMIDENKKYIIMEDSNKLFFRKNNIKFNLNKGTPIFDETINVLNNLEPMNKLILNKNIIEDLPDNEDDINNFDYINNQVTILQKNGNHISSYWKEKIKDPEIAFLMMVIDDNYVQEGLKRKDLINPEYKYIGISSIEINDKFACYITLSNRK